MKHISYTKAIEKAKNIDWKLTARDFGSYDWIYIVFDEGLEGTALYRSAFCRTKGDWQYVFREHGPPLVFHKDEAVIFSFQQVNEKALGCI